MLKSFLTNSLVFTIYDVLICHPIFAKIWNFKIIPWKLGPTTDVGECFDAINQEGI